MNTTLTELDPATGELVPYQAAASSGLIVGRTPQDILGHATVIAGAMKDVIERQGFAVSMGGKRKPHVEVGGWQAAGAMLAAFGGEALFAETVMSRREDRPDGEIAYTAKVEIRTRDGALVGSDEGFCSSTEEKWQHRDEYAIKGMAATRAEGRAYRRPLSWLMSMAGYSPTVAEEMPQHDAPAGVPAWAQPGDVGNFAQSLVAVLTAVGAETPEEAVSAIGQVAMDECDNTIPACLEHFVRLITARIPPQPDTEETP